MRHIAQPQHVWRHDERHILAYGPARCSSDRRPDRVPQHTDLNESDAIGSTFSSSVASTGLSVTSAIGLLGETYWP